ncbi:hypothetical protein [Pararhodonellum marinum]|uniref:hypothetical protein n=1 Tax=Pararhodonellum marinum TaxID=2755358 RepID=UPI00188FEBE3|nr:hypothetical protein [Pararhodonellum marinum]
MNSLFVVMSMACHSKEKHLEANIAPAQVAVLMASVKELFWNLTMDEEDSNPW